MRVSTSDRDLDELAAVGAVIARSVDLLAPSPHHTPLDQQLKIYATPFIVPKAVVEGMPEPVEAEVLGTAIVGTVEERTMANLLSHNDTERETVDRR